MASLSQVEYWLRGPVAGVPALLQPVAHALLQARDEISKSLIDFPEELLWRQPAGVASPAFHLQHIAGVIDRLFTYAKGNQLEQQQLNYLAAEGKQDASIRIASLLDHLNKEIDNAIEQLKNTAESSLNEPRGVGRKQLPSTIAGLLFHAAEHTMRHTGQLLVTVQVVRTF
jgi:uncharacterized damage-inducible protein DinB